MIKTASQAIKYLEHVLLATDFPGLQEWGIREVIDYLKVIKLQEETELDQDIRRSYPVSTRGSGQPAED